MRFRSGAWRPRPPSRGSPRAGFAPTTSGATVSGPHFEAGDAFPFGGRSWSATARAPRSRPSSTRHRLRRRGPRSADHPPGHVPPRPGLLPAGRARGAGVPAAFDAASAAAGAAGARPASCSRGGGAHVLRQLGLVGRTVVMPACPTGCAELEAWGFEVVLVDVSEFHKGGGSVRCLTNPLDVACRPRPRPPGGW